MSRLIAIFRELWGLFVDDGSLALALVLWCAAMGVLGPVLLRPSWNAPILFLGCVVILVTNVAVAALRRAR